MIAPASDGMLLKYELKAPLYQLPAPKPEVQTRLVLFVAGLPPLKSGIMQVVSGPRAAAMNSESNIPPVRIDCP